MADGIPYVQAPRLEQANPLQTIGALQGVEQRQQAMALQQQQNTAKMALGQLMQQHIDPETGELNAEEMITHASTVPEIRPIMSEVMTMMLSNKHLNEQILGQKLQNAAARLDTNSNLAAAMYDERMRKGLMRQGVDKAGDRKAASDFIAQQVAAGTLERGKPASEALLNLTANIEKGAKFDDMLRTLALSAPKGIEGIKATGTTLQQLTAPIETFDNNPESETYGNKIRVPAYQVQGAVPPGAEGLMGRPVQKTANTASVGSAPPDQGAARQGSQPSVTPAARYQNLAEAPIPAQREIAYQKGEGPHAELGKGIEEAASAAAQSNQAIEETRGLLKDIESLGKSGTGPTAPMRKAAAKLLMDAENAVKSFDPSTKEGKIASTVKSTINGLSKIVTGSDNPKEWTGAAEAFEKLAAVTAIAGLRNSVGPSNKVTQQEVIKFMELFPGLSSSPGGIKRMLSFMDKVNSTAIDRQKYFNYWTDLHRTDRKKGYNPTKFNEDWDDVLQRAAKARSKDEVEGE